MSDRQSSDEAPVEIFATKGKNNSRMKGLQRVRNPRKAIGKNEPAVRKRKLKQLKDQLLNNIKSKLEEQKIAKQLSQIPLNFGNQLTNKVIIQQNTVLKKSVSCLAVDIVHRTTKPYRKAVNRLQAHLRKSDHLRGNMQDIQSKRNSKR